MKTVLKLMSVLLVVLIISTALTSLPITAAAEVVKSGTSGDCTWALTDDGVLTINGKGAMGDNNASFEDAPWRRESISSVIIKDGVTSIGSDAFYGCTGLTSVDIPESVTSIGSSAFGGCTGLTSVTIPDSVTTISYNAFSSCTGLTSVDIPDSVTSIDWYAFRGCTGLTSVTIGNSVTSIGQDAFYGCTRLTGVYITDIAAWCGIRFEDPVPDGSSSPSSNPLSYAHNLYLNNELVTDLVIPDSVTTISYNAFSSCTGLTSVTIPDSVTRVGDFAFSKCTGLTSVTIGNGNTGIGRYAFYGCTGLTSVTIGNGNTGIGNYAFNGCTGLKSITIGNGVTSMGSYAFGGCTGLTGVYITDIAAWCGIIFKGIQYNDSSDGNSYSNSNPLSYAHNLYLNNELVTDLVIPDSVKRIGNFAFYGCTGLTSITIPKSVTSIGAKAFLGCNNLTIIGYSGSSAETYAKNNSIPFVDIESIKYVDKTDEATGIVLNVESGVDFHVSEKTDQAELGNIVIPDGEQAARVFDISLSKGGETVQPSGKVTVKIPCDNENARVYRVEADNSLTNMNAVYENGYLVFTTEHFSIYIMTVPKQYSLGDSNLDGVIDVTDATQIQLYAAGLIDFTDEQFAIADVDSDGAVDVTDATQIQLFAAGLIADF